MLVAGELDDLPNGRRAWGHINEVPTTPIPRIFYRRKLGKRSGSNIEDDCGA